MSLGTLARKLADATRGYDWEASSVEDAVRAILGQRRHASRSELDAAVSILCERVAQSQLEDSDGVAHVAITAGSLVESGAGARALGEVLRIQLPSILVAARRFANTCLREIEDPEADVDDAIVQVDSVDIPRALFRAKLPGDRGGGVALAQLRNWVLPAVASWTRDRPLLEEVTGDAELVAAAAAMRDLDAYFVDCLLGVELDARWLVILPLEGRGFDVRVDGIVRNCDVHALLAEALGKHGLSVAKNPDSVLAPLRAERDAPEGASIRGSWNMYSYRASTHDLRAKVPLDLWVWGEGAPRDIPKFEGRRTLLLGPSAPERGWSAGRTFSKLLASVVVERELQSNDVARRLEAMRRSV